MYKILLPTLLASLLINTAQANQPTDIKCPSSTAIAAVGLKQIYQNGDKTWSGVELINKYDTNTVWSFGMWEFDAKDQADATVKANAALKTIAYVAGPRPIPQAIICVYKTDIAYAAALHFTGKTSKFDIKELHKYI